MLTGGAVAIAAGAQELLGFSTTLALVQSDAASLGATSDNGIDDFAMNAGHRVGVMLKIFGAEGRKDFTNGGHDRVPPSRD